MKSWLKGGLIGLGVWIILLIIYFSLGISYECTTDPFLVGGSCESPGQETILIIFMTVGFLVNFVNASPNLSTAGPAGIQLFWIVTAVTFILWGILISWIVKKVRSKK